MASIDNTLSNKGNSDLGLKLSRFRELGIIVFLLAVIGVTLIFKPNFLRPINIRSILLWIPLLVIIASGEMMVIITRGIDLSVGSMLAFSGIVVGMIFRDNPEFNIFAGVFLGILIGAGLGAINGLLIAWASIPPIITTLGTLSVYRGFVFIVSGSRQINPNDVPTALIRWSQRGPFGLQWVPWVVIIAVAIAILAALFLKYTKRGRNIYAIGGNPDAALLRGIPVQSTIFLVYLITGAASGLAGIMYASRFGFVNPGETGVGFELTVIAAVVIGGTNIFGGSGTVLGVFLGSLLLGTINVALSVLGVASTWQLAVYGFVILLAVTVDAVIQRELRRATTGE
ncbi:MAG: ABC transporter permease [Chloroflexi bacterium]|nr:ABC transporter permease [Chloroflexota bacterium]